MHEQCEKSFRETETGLRNIMIKLLFTVLSTFALIAFSDEIPAYAQAENARLDREMTPLLKLSGPAEGNLARGKGYVFSDKPNYGGCSGDSDATDLTNGKSESSATGIWVCQDCVCWDSKELVSVTIDLEKEDSIGRVKLFSGGGRAGVHLPAVALVEASDDGKSFHLVGDLVTLSKVRLPRENIGFRVFVFDGEFEPVRARYVRLRMRPTGLYLPITEIEVFAAKGESRTVASLSDSQSDDMLKVQGERAVISMQMRENMFRLAEDVRYDGCGYDELLDAIGHYSFDGDVENFHAVYPLCDVQKQIFARHAAHLRRKGEERIVLQPCDFYDVISPVALPKTQNELVLRQTMMNGEVRGCSLLLCNTTQREMHVRARLEGFEGDIYETGYIDSEFFYPTSTYLKAHGELCAVPGLVCQLAVRLKPQGLPVGLHKGGLLIEVDGEQRAVPVEVEILADKMTAAPKLLTYAWDYLDLPAKNAKRAWLGLPAKHFAQFRQKRNADLCLGTVGVGAQELAACPTAIKVDAEGNILSELDFHIFDNWIANNQGVKIFGVVAIGLNWNNAKFGDKKLEPGSAAFDRAVEAWAHCWREHLKGRGLLGRVFMQLFDEPGLNPKQDVRKLYALMQKWHTPFHRGAPEISLFIDPCNIYPVDCNAFLTNGEIVCPEAELLHGDGAEERLDAFRQLREQGHPLHVYSCSFGPFMGEPGAFRNQAWMAFRIGGVASGFWGGTATDSRTSFNRYIHNKNYYSPYLLDNEGLHLTKHACAQRDGVQDYEYLVRCEALLAEREAAGGDVSALRQRFQILVKEVAGSRELYNGIGTGMAARAENARLEIIAIIKQLKEK